MHAAVFSDAGAAACCIGPPRLSRAGDDLLHFWSLGARGVGDVGGGTEPPRWEPVLLNACWIIADGRRRVGYHAHSCGYCKSKAERRSSGHGSSGSPSYYVSAKYLTPKFYEDLICRGWRRSGTLLYKPDLRNSCCPHYTLRLDATAFRATKDQRQAQNRFNHYILGDEYIKETARLHPKSKAEAARYKQTFDLCERVHESELDYLPGPTKPAHEFTVTLEPDTFTEEKYLVYENYQRIVQERTGFSPRANQTRPRVHSHIRTRYVHRREIPRLRELPAHSPQGGARRYYPPRLPQLPLRLEGEAQHRDRRRKGEETRLLPPMLPSRRPSRRHWRPGPPSRCRQRGLLSIPRGPAPMEPRKAQRAARDGTGDRAGVQVYILDPEKYTWDLLDEGLKLRMDARRYVSLSSEKARGIPAPATKEEAAAAAAS
ncbi:hypothetical protein V495_04333, partial [Pseudogymnoascus sp. VKM F-4514 (FW-929)]